MADPVLVACSAGAWTKVASGVTSGSIWIIDSAGLMLQTYRMAGGAAPTQRSEGVVIDRPGDNISSIAAIDVYVWADNADGMVRVDL